MSKRESTEERKKRARKIVTRLKKMYPDAHTALHHKTPLQLLIATILSAQCTDERVNKVTPDLFKRYPTAKDLAQASQEELEHIIHSTGFYRNKAANIIKCCQAIVGKHKGKVPKTLDELVELGGVGRKTANVVLGNAFDTPAMVVDTHVKRISNLLRLTKNQDPVKIEHDLMEIIPKKDWTMLAHYFISHGRSVCKARRPQCDQCDLNDLCPSSQV